MSANKKEKQETERISILSESSNEMFDKGKSQIPQVASVLLKQPSVL